MSSEPQPTPESNYPNPGEVGNDADAIAKIVAAIMRAGGSDPNMVSASDAWNFYVNMWRTSVAQSGQQLWHTDWEQQLSADSELGQRFKFEWESHARLGRLIDGTVMVPKGFN